MFRIVGSVLLAFAIINRFVPTTDAIGDDDFNIFVERAVNFWVTKQFAQSYQEMTLPSESAAAAGSRLYSEKKEPDFEGNGKAGILFNLSMDKLKEALNMWQSNGLVSNEAVDNMRNIIGNSNFKTIADYVHVRENGQIIYAIIGFIELKTNDGSRSGTILYSFTRFKLNGDTVITSDNTDDARCTMWGQYCPTYFRVGGFSDSDSESLFSHIRMTAIKLFVEQSQPYLSYLNKESERYERFLPESFSSKLRTLKNNPNKLATELFSEDPFAIDRL